MNRVFFGLNRLKSKLNEIRQMLKLGSRVCNDVTSAKDIPCLMIKSECYVVDSDFPWL